MEDHVVEGNLLEITCKDHSDSPAMSAAATSSDEDDEIQMSHNKDRGSKYSGTSRRGGGGLQSTGSSTTSNNHRGKNKIKNETVKVSLREGDESVFH